MLTAEQKAKRNATRARNAAIKETYLAGWRADKLARERREKNRLARAAKIKAVADDQRGEPNTRAIAAGILRRTV